MDESQSLFSNNSLPPKRKAGAGYGSNSESIQVNKLDSIQEKISSIENEIDPELLAELEKAVKEVGSEAIIDIPIQSKESTITAPILEDYIDPHTVPIKYLLEQARAEVKSEDIMEETLERRALILITFKEQ